MLQRKFKLAATDHKAGTYLVVDTSNVTPRGEVLAHQYHWDKDGNLVSTINHTDRPFEQACDEILAQGALELSPKDWRKGGLC